MIANSGYAGEILKIDLSGGGTERLPSAPYTERFLGGRGAAAQIYWDMGPSPAGAFDAENCLICATGPVTGFTGISGGSPWQVRP